MVLTCQPIFDCIESLKTEDSKVIMLTPDGVPYTQKLAYQFSTYSHIILLCGHKQH